MSTGVDVQPTGRSGFEVWRCLPNGHANDKLRADCKWCGARRPCDYFDGEATCGEPSTHMYISGPRCDPHSPRALRTSRETSPTRMEHAA